jgi:hypothetical protein
MRLIHLFFLCFGLAAHAAVIQRPNNNTAEIEARDAATGYRSVAYFVNWVCNSNVFED